MRSFDTRAIENIATAPATQLDRRTALLTVAGLLSLFLISIPFGRNRLGEVDAFLPIVVGASIVALLLTAVLLYVQYRIERDAKLGLLAIGYVYAAATLTFYVLTFPRLFTDVGLLGAGLQTAAWWYALGYLGFAAWLVAQEAVDRFGVRISRAGIRLIALLAVVLVIVMALGLSLAHDRLPSLVGSDGTFTPLWRNVMTPVLAGVMVACAAFVAGRFTTVIQIWLPVLLISRVLDLVTSSSLGGARFSVGWYSSRIDTLFAAIVVLGVFLVKINDLMLRLAARSRSTAEALAVGEARYASLANVVPQLIWTTNANGEVEYVNDRWVAFTGYDLSATREGGWRTAIHPEQEIVVMDRWRHSVRTGEPFAAEYRLREGATGRYRWFLVNAVPARGNRGEILAWIGTCTDVDTQKRLEEREAFLARAGERLGASLDVNATVAAMKTLLIPRLAERTWVALLDDEGRYILTGLGSTDISDELDTRRWIGAPLQPALHEAVSRIVETGYPVVLDKPDRFPDPWVRDRPAGAAMIVPLVNGEAPVGALALVRTTGRAYDTDDVALVREFARRAALSLEHARLYERERTTADALQRAMLPAQLPLLPDIRFSASYSAASESQRVGGDFYDAFALPDGRVAVAIGDVTGHGLEAAVVMGEIRQALRAASFESADPAAILDRASRLLIASGRTVFVTAIFGVLDPVTGRFAYATAGHPPPLLRDARGVRRLPASGLPIGLRDEEGVDFALRLRAPCTIVMYTDGLMEFARDLGEGERRIESAISALDVADVDHLAGALMKNVLGEDEPTDDIAILAVTIDRFAAELPGEEHEWRFSSEDGRTGAKIRQEIGELIARWTGDENARFASELAFGELIANAVRHAPGPVRALATTEGDGVAHLVIEDSGTGFAASENELPDPLAETGRGLSLVRAVADVIRIDRTSRGSTRVTVTFRPAVGTLATATT
ncbi:MAG TPA: SpoIIE family protein phosphatase [Candidatus Limnocylindrales bacterium]|nr:SpoIIE family protein phosphatase [Candidatus Limnocylindrales bacterium]